MARNFDLKGYAVVTSLSHGLLGPLKRNLDRFRHMSGSPNAFMGGGAVLGGFPDPEKVVLAPGCMRDALFDEDLPKEDRGYREIFGDRVMLEVQGYVKKIPEAQVRFRTDPERAGDLEDTIVRIEQALESLGVTLDAEDRTKIEGHLS